MEIFFRPEELIDEIDLIQTLKLPRATYRSMNRALFLTRERLREEANRTFDKPVKFTLNSFLYGFEGSRNPIKNPVKGRYESKIYVREWSDKGGNAPSRYLNPSIRGATAYRTRFPRATSRNTYAQQIDGRLSLVGQGGTIFRPTGSKRVRPNLAKAGASYPTMRGGQYTQILSALRGGRSSAETEQMTVTAWRAKSYQYIDEQSLKHPFFDRRFRNASWTKPGIYKIETLFGRPRFYRVLTEDKPQRGKNNFDFFGISDKTFTENFARELRANLQSM